MISLKPGDLQHINVLGIKISEIENQLELLIKGTPPIILIAPATPENGILILSDEEYQEYANIYNRNIGNIDSCRFVPASGAASRMFKAFYQYLEDGIVTSEIEVFEKEFRLFPFVEEIKCKDQTDYSCAINRMMNNSKLPELPKALIPFHRYKDESRTAFEEQIVESAMVLEGVEKVKLHFTISKDHQVKFQELITHHLEKYGARFGTIFNITFSHQEPSTDTIAINTNNEPARNEDMTLIFRPGGHGALLENLNTLGSDLIFIKNIDNIQPDHIKEKNIFYKKALTGYILSIKDEIHGQLKLLEEQSPDLTSPLNFIQDKLNIRLPAAFDELDQKEKISFVVKKLNRPIRVCSMVKNVGEPGGGPFWVKNRSEEVSLQIVESSQINLSDPDQKEIFNHSTHFNPVDIVCWVKDYQGNKFNLLDFTDPETSFISEKSQNGQSLKVLEHPGLWNGAMSDWITLFIEVPISTFSPVKTITDLLRKDHQPK